LGIVITLEFFQHSLTQHGHRKPPFYDHEVITAMVGFCACGLVQTAIWETSQIATFPVKNGMRKQDELPGKLDFCPKIPQMAMWETEYARRSSFSDSDFGGVRENLRIWHPGHSLRMPMFL